LSLMLFHPCRADHDHITGVEIVKAFLPTQELATP
jgi:hypothetical protein